MNDKKVTKNLLKNKICKNCYNLKRDQYGNWCNQEGYKNITDLYDTCAHWTTKIAFGTYLPVYTTKLINPTFSTIISNA